MTGSERVHSGNRGPETTGPRTTGPRTRRPQGHGLGQTFQKPNLGQTFQKKKTGPKQNERHKTRHIPYWYETLTCYLFLPAWDFVIHSHGNWSKFRLPKRREGVSIIRPGYTGRDKKREEPEDLLNGDKCKIWQSISAAAVIYSYICLSLSISVCKLPVRG